MSHSEKKIPFSRDLLAVPARRSAGQRKVDSSAPWAQLITRAAQAAVGSHAVQIELDLPAEIDCPLSPRMVASLVRSMVSAAVEATDKDSSILITVCSNAQSFEIEVADEGPSLQFRPQRIPMAAASAGAELVWQDCPQGGVAVTAVLTREPQQRMAA